MKKKALILLRFPSGLPYRSTMRNNPALKVGSKLLIFVAAANFVLCMVGVAVCEAQGSRASGTSIAAAENNHEQAAQFDPCEVVENNFITPTTPFISNISDDVTLVLRDLDTCLKREGVLVSDLRVALDGTMLPKLSPIPGPAKQNYVKFTLRIDPYDRDDRTHWAKIIRAMRYSNNGVTFTLGNGKTGQVFPSRQRIIINLYPSYTSLVTAGLFVLLIGLIALGIKSNLLRDNPSGEKDPNASYPFSLGRAQMAFWFYLVIAGYLYIWLLTGQSYTPTGSILVLLGISSATGFAAAIVDRSKTSDANNKRSDLEIQKLALESRIAEMDATHPSPGSDLYKQLMEKKDQLAVISLQLANTPRPATSRSAGLLKDLFCDGDGVSFHRFQIIVWTIVLGMVFINAVHIDLAMPDFDATLLGLMGLSSGTYIGFKFPEKAK
jgi:hypothetical protein